MEKKLPETWEERLKISAAELVSEILEERFGIFGKCIEPEEIPPWFLSDISSEVANIRLEAAREERERVLQEVEEALMYW